MTLGEYIRLYRAEHGLSQREFVERCGGRDDVAAFLYQKIPRPKPGVLSYFPSSVRSSGTSCSMTISAVV